MLILILIEVQHSQKAVFRFEKGLNSQSHSSSGSYHLVKKNPPTTAKYLIPPSLGGIPPSLPLFGKPCIYLPLKSNIIALSHIINNTLLTTQPAMAGWPVLFCFLAKKTKEHRPSHLCSNIFLTLFK